MGCSASKDFVDRPSLRKSTKEAQEAVLARGLAGFTRMNGGYIAAIFSANYANTLRHPMPLQDLQRDQLLLAHHPPSFDDYPQREARSSDEANVRIPKTGSAIWDIQKADGPLVTNAKSVVSTKADFEMINAWELMKDLNEQEDCSDVDSLHVHDDHPLMTERSVFTTSFFNEPTHEMVQSTASSNLASTALILRSKYLTSFELLEDSEVRAAASKDMVSTPESSLCALLQGVDCIHMNEEIKNFCRPTLRKLLNKMYLGDIISEFGGLATCQRTCEMMPSRELSLQRALSMKYILNDDTGENDQWHFLDVSDTTALTDDADSREEAAPLDSCSRESECSSSLLSREVSVTASLKDWLPSESPSFTNKGSIENDSDAYVFEAIQAPHIMLAQQMMPYLRPSTRRVLSKYVQGGEYENVDVSGLQYTKEADMSSSKVEHPGVHTLDIKRSNSFDFAAQHDK